MCRVNVAWYVGSNLTGFGGKYCRRLELPGAPEGRRPGGGGEGDGVGSERSLFGINSRAPEVSNIS